MTHNPTLQRIYIILLAIVAVLTSNMYVPGIPLIQASLHTSTHAIQMSISYYMLGLAIGMLFYGPLSDHFGRRPVLYSTLLVYIAGLILSVVSNNIQIFLVSRVLQALGAAGALALWQAISTNLYKENAPKMIALGFIVIGTIPALSPIVGSYIIHYLGWQSIFIILIFYGAILITTTYKFAPRATAKHTTNSSHWLRTSLQRYGVILHSPKFILLALFTSVMYSQLYAFVAQTPSILHALNYTTREIGLSYIPISISFIIGSFLAKLMLSKYPESNKPIIIGLAIYALGTALQICFQIFLTRFNIITLITPFSFITIGTGMMLPIIVGRAMRIFIQHSGSSASFIGAIQNLMAFSLSSIAALLSHTMALGLTLSLSFIVTAAIILGIINLLTKDK